ncbi:MAG: 4Fe-4S dicluster domain-containing protein, partial [Thermodesulfobacteriota bacterium]
MSDCAKCGACTVVCPVLRTSGRESHSARGKLHLLDVLGLARASTEFVDIFSACLLCGACTDICPRQIDVCSELVSARKSFSATSGPHGYEKYLARKLLDFPASLKSLRTLGRGGEKLLGSRLPEDSGLRLRLALFDEAGLTVSPAHESMEAEKAGRPLTWFPGCASRYLFPATHSACRSLLASASCTL